MEAYWLINLFVDFLILALSCRGIQRQRPGRLLFAAVLGATFACAPLPWALRLLSFPLMCAAVCRDRHLPRFLAQAALGYLIFGGAAAMCLAVMGAWDWKALLLFPAAGSLALLCLPGSHARGQIRPHIRLRLLFGGRRAEVLALVDTGNRLREPISALPVLVAEEALLLSLLPDGYGAGGLPSGFRKVKYGGVGGGGEMLCFLPDRIFALRNRRWIAMPDVWVALYPGRLPGGVQALAPEEMGLE